MRPTQVKLPLEVINANFGELRHDEAAHPIGRCGSCCSASSPAERVDLGIVHPGNLGETGAIEEVVEEEHGCGDSPELSLSVSLIPVVIPCCSTHKLLSVIICACSIFKAH